MDELDEEAQGRRRAHEAGSHGLLSLDPYTTGLSSLEPEGGPGLSSLEPDDLRAPSTTDLSTNTLGTSLWGENGVWASRPQSAVSGPASAVSRPQSAVSRS